MTAPGTAFTFFGCAGFECSAREGALKVAALVGHPEERTGVILSGRLVTSHGKLQNASTRRQWELLKSISADKRWVIRESSARIDKIFLICRRPDENSKLPSWVQLQSSEHQYLASLLSGEASVDWFNSRSVL